MVKQLTKQEIRLLNPLSKLSKEELDLVAKVLNDEIDLWSLYDTLYFRLYELYCGSMPIGTAKARDGDPVEWIYYKLFEDYERFMND